MSCSKSLQKEEEIREFILMTIIFVFFSHQNNRIMRPHLQRSNSQSKQQPILPGPEKLVCFFIQFIEEVLNSAICIALALCPIIIAISISGHQMDPIQVTYPASCWLDRPWKDPELPYCEATPSNPKLTQAVIR
jgi:hypothetical protein